MTSCMDKIDNLPDAIVYRAVIDYMDAMVAGDEYTIAECERFFRSEWFYTLTSADGESFIKRLRSKKDMWKTQRVNDKRRSKS